MTDAALTDAARILDGSPVPTFVIDSSHVIVYWNEALARMSGVPAAEVLGTHHQWRAFYPFHRPVMADIVVDGGSEFLLEKFYHGNYRRAEHAVDGWESEAFFPTFGEEGCWLAFSAAPIRNADGEIVGCVETLQDVSERMEADISRRQAQRQLAEIISGSPVATFVVDENCRTTHWNRACETLTGVLAAEVIGKGDVWRAFYPDESRRVVLAELIVRGVSIEQLKESYAERAHPSALVQGAFEARDFFPAFGESGKWLHFMAAPLHDIRGNVVGAIETLVDLSDRVPGK
jgi:PAS domain-containing protein